MLLVAVLNLDYNYFLSIHHFFTYFLSLSAPPQVTVWIVWLRISTRAYILKLVEIFEDNSSGDADF